MTQRSQVWSEILELKHEVHELRRENQQRAEEWCADFAAWVWYAAGVQFAYGYDPGQINAAAASVYSWGVANGDRHPRSRNSTSDETVEL